MVLNTQTRTEEQEFASSPSIFGNMSELTIRSTAQVYGLHMDAARTLLEAWAGTAAAFGFPDYSAALIRGEPLRTVLANMTDQLVYTSARAIDAATQVRRQVHEVHQARARALARIWQEGVEQLGIRTGETLKHICATTDQQMEQFKLAAQRNIEETRTTVSSAADQLFWQVDEGAKLANKSTPRFFDTLVLAGL